MKPLNEIQIFSNDVCVIALAILVFITDVCECLTCARCESSKDHYVGQCKNDPPAPSSCMKDLASQMYCVVVEEYVSKSNLSEQWELNKFHRDCAYMKYLPSKFKNGRFCQHVETMQGDDSQICSLYCESDGCNSANILRIYMYNIILCISIVLMSYNNELV